ncbi:MAG TPA: hypothetical protein VGM08_00450 [Candidatus Saccharimonadales bacterium]|jgi:hypothetical protein
MKAKQLYYVLAGCCALLVLALFGIGYEANKVLGAQATKLSKLRADSEVASSQQAFVLQDKKDIQKYSELNTIAESVVPQDKDQAQAVRQIVNLASANHIQLSSVTFPASTLGAITTNTAQTKLTQLVPVVGITGVYNLAITITQDTGNTVPYNDFLSFLSGLEQNRRTAQVTSITVQPDPKQPNNVSFTLTVSEFIRP